jgi:hypothetical protein
MTESNESFRFSTDPTPTWLTATAASIAGFTIAVLSLFGNGAWLFPVQVFVVSEYNSGNLGDTATWLGIIQTLLAVLALGLAWRALHASAASQTARHLAGATYVVGGLGLLVGVLTLVAGLTS